MANREQLALIHGARAGDAHAQLALGRHYIFGGKGLPKSLPTALHWLDRAARQGSDEAWLLIGMHIPFEVAAGAVNMPQLLEWYERAFEAKVMQAALVFARLAQSGTRSADAAESMEKARRMLDAAAESGMAEARSLLTQWQQEKSGRTQQAVTANGSALATAPEGATAAADVGIAAACHALAERAWAAADYTTFLRWSLPLARSLVRRSLAAT